jgi:tetratricopeptide (TPR) repeat protein
MRAAVAACLLLTAMPAAAQSQYGQRYAEPTEEIVVTGIRIRDYRDRLAACLARNCPPNEDIDATLALAEALLLDGEYGEARTVARESIRRNRGHAAQYPEPVSDLFRTHMRLARHTGWDREAIQSAHNILNALQAGIPQEDHRHFTARFELAELLMTMGRYRPAKRELERLARLARAAGRDDVAIMADLRGLLYDEIALPRGPARARLIELASLADPARRLETMGATALLARIYRSEGDNERADTLLAQIGRGNSRQRRLLHAPRYELIGLQPADGESFVRVAENFEGKWIDVGFWVMPDGRVAEMEVLRSGGESVWARPLLQSIRGRLYSTAEEPTYRLERYTLTAGREQPTGTRMQQQMSDTARIEYLDLTAGHAPPPTRGRSNGLRPI